MTKRRIYKRYRKGKRGGQRYWKNYNSLAPPKGLPNWKLWDYQSKKEYDEDKKAHKQQNEDLNNFRESIRLWPDQRLNNELKKITKRIENKDNTFFQSGIEQHKWIILSQARKRRDEYGT